MFSLWLQALESALPSDRFREIKQACPPEAVIKTDPDRAAAFMSFTEKTITREEHDAVTKCRTDFMKNLARAIAESTKQVPFQNKVYMAKL